MPRFELNDADVVVIVGSGAGGGTMANELTRRGLKVVLFEVSEERNAAIARRSAPVMRLP